MRRAACHIGGKSARSVSIAVRFKERCGSTTKGVRWSKIPAPAVASVSTTVRPSQPRSKCGRGVFGSEPSGVPLLCPSGPSFRWKWTPLIGEGACARTPLVAICRRSGATWSGAVLSHVEQTVRTHSRDLFLLASHFNEAAHRFYARHGYREVGQLPAYVRPDITEHIFWKRLRSP